ncbi:hypothetical protein LOK49_LG15G02225 [Camellia lanceoleosa]|uniref:Uncharacterized protein n=1 Tax=Camellia lanceoleosa TaxID=1840588 RepID=A0ACC0F736_9ERIC|nr:hypothetical protein LOK49_LG15G02225 [Camellia lanceoleosa]
MCPWIEAQTFMSIVRFGIGTFNKKSPYKEYYLDMDTGELERHFLKFKNLKRYNSNPSNLTMCYETNKAEEFKNLPIITFHFKGTRANMVVMPEGSFEVRLISIYNQTTCDSILGIGDSSIDLRSRARTFYSFCTF